ncbi:MAG: asparagine synthase-related protein [Nanoarchaeota archaeon]
MCGIYGVMGEAAVCASQVQMLAHRGRDAAGYLLDGNLYEGALTEDLQCATGCFVHFLHAMVGHVPQPMLEESDWFVANCEIYNWMTMGDGESRNDAEAFFTLLRRYGVAGLSVVDGDYACAWKHGEDVLLFRDPIGVKPLWWYVEDGVLRFASENKALGGKGALLNPSTILRFRNGEVEMQERQVFEAAPELDDSEGLIVGDLRELLQEAVEKRLAGVQRVGILFSGGIDSVLIAKLAKDLGKEVLLFTAGHEDAADVAWAKEAAEDLRLPLYVATETEESAIRQAIQDIKRIIGSDNYVKVSVALPFYFSLRLAAQHRLKVVMTGLGSEELFAGYQRHVEATDINRECRTGLRAIHERDLSRDDALAMHYGMELRLPLLDLELARFALQIPASLKIRGDVKKYIIRKTALICGIGEKYAMRPKKAAQYGSGYDKLLGRMARKADLKKQDLVRSL